MAGRRQTRHERPARHFRDRPLHHRRFGPSFGTQCPDVDGDEQLVVTDVMLAESWFVLTRVYGLSRAAAVDQLIALVRKPNIETYPLDKDLVIEALLLCRPSGRFSIADALLWATARMRGEAVRTFDRRFPGDGIELLTPMGGV